MKNGWLCEPYILYSERILIKSVVGQFIIFANFEEKKNHQTLNTSFDIWKIKLKNEKEKKKGAKRKICLII